MDAAAGRLIHGSAPCYRKKHLQTGTVRRSSEEDSALSLSVCPSKEQKQNPASRLISRRVQCPFKTYSAQDILILNMFDVHDFISGWMITSVLSSQ